MTLRVQKGDLFDADLPAIGHGCNIQGVMGAGIAKEFRRRWPAMYDEYRRRCRDGRFQLGDVFVWEGTPIVFNLATQPRPGPSATLEAIASSVSRMMRMADESDIPAVGVPRIGAGLGGLVWEDVLDTLRRVSQSTKAELIVFEL